MRNTLLSRVALVVLGVSLLTSCATQPAPPLDSWLAQSPPGFWMGIVHGLVAPLALLGSIFLDIRIYAFPNSGGWYDFGYVLGLFTSIGGSTAAR